MLQIYMLGSEQSSSESSTEKEKKSRRKRVVPVMDACLKVKPKQKGIVINLSMTKYEVIAEVAEQLDWTLQYSTKKGDWDVLWTDHMVEPETLIKMHFFQKISHFPGIHVLARKNLLGLSFMEMRKVFPDTYNFFPRTWLLPSDYSDFRQQVQKSANEETAPCFIVKPEADCQGKGIFLTFKTDDVENGKHYVVQEYIDRPFLVDGLKFDFRIYVLLCGTNPMRLYCYGEGLARLATEKYAPPSKANLKRLYMHLTNYAINKKNPKYVYNSSSRNMDIGHKRSMSSVFANMERRGLNANLLKERIYDVLVKTLILGQPLVSHQYKFAQPDDEHRNMCFHILGIDVMIDQLLNPIVLEVNHTPSFATDTPLDHSIKSSLIRDTLQLMNITEKAKKELIKKTNSYQRERITNVKMLIETQEKKQAVRDAQEMRDEYENSHLGRYTKIYPVADPSRMARYEEYFKQAEKIYFSENNVIRAQIEAERQKDKASSKKSLNKKSPISSPSKSATRPAHSERHSEELIRLKNSSAEFFTSDRKISSLLSHPVSSLISPGLSSMGKASGFHSGKGYIKITKSIGEQEEDLGGSQCNRVSMVKNLPKIEQASPMKSSTIQISKYKYTSLRKKKMSDNQEQRKLLSSKLGEKKESLLGGFGAFLTPKVMRFQNYLEEEVTERNRAQGLGL